MRYKGNRDFLIRRLTLTAMMVALEVVLSRYLSISTPFMKIGFGFLPMALTAMLYGPVYAGVAWALSDFLGAILLPMAPYFYGFTVSAFLNGVIWGLFLYKYHAKILNTASAILLSSVLVTLGLDTLWLTIYTGNPAMMMLGWRFMRFAVMAPVQFVMLTVAGNYFSGFIYNNSMLATQKKELRKEALKYYNGEFLPKRDEISADITGKVLSLSEYKTARTVFCYVGRHNEIDTSGLIKAALADGKTVAVPLSAVKGAMSARRITSLEELKKGRYGVMEPYEDSEVVEPDDIDLALIPSLVCDSKCRRIGFGGGYYDRFLKKRRMTKVMLCPPAMMKKRIASGMFDQHGDMVIY